MLKERAKLMSFKWPEDKAIVRKVLQIHITRKNYEAIGAICLRIIGRSTKPIGGTVDDLQARFDAAEYEAMYEICRKELNDH